MTLRPPSQEHPFTPLAGWTVFLGLLAFWITVPTLAVRWGLSHGAAPLSTPYIVFLVLAGLAALAAVVMLCGFFLVNPNMARVLVLFGRYRGTVRSNGFFWTNPFTMKHSISLRAHNVASEKIKVNDLLGNPIEIGAVVVWQVRDTAQTSFDVENHVQYVDVQIEAAVRQLAKKHAYDDGLDEAAGATLRGDDAAVTQLLQEELQQRLDRAGIEVLEARISHLAYAPEIASAMLQRQQASAVIAARQKIVEGAVMMVEDALTQLNARSVVDLDAERRATLVGNLLVVLCGQASPQPVLNTGSLYT